MGCRGLGDFCCGAGEGLVLAGVVPPATLKVVEAVLVAPNWSMTVAVAL